MKRFFLFIFLMFVTGTSLAQNWCPPGAKWLYKAKDHFLLEEAIVEYVYSKDSLISGRSCKEIIGTYAGKYPLYSIVATYSVIPGYRRYYTFEENHVVYVYNGFNGFDTVTDYNAVPGDTWLAPRNSNCAVRSCFTVVDTNTSVYNGVRLKSLIISPTTTYVPAYQFTITEKLYMFSGRVDDIDMFPFHCLSHWNSDPPNVRLICYQDDGFGVYNPNGETCIQGVGINPDESNNPRIEVYPNPFSNYLEIRSSSEKKVRLLDLYDRVLFELGTGASGAVRIDASEVPNGLYILESESPGGAKTHVKVLKE